MSFRSRWKRSGAAEGKPRSCTFEGFLPNFRRELFAPRAVATAFNPTTNLLLVRQSLVKFGLYSGIPHLPGYCTLLFCGISSL